MISARTRTPGDTRLSEERKHRAKPVLRNRQSSTHPVHTWDHSRRHHSDTSMDHLRQLCHSTRPTTAPNPSRLKTLEARVYFQVTLSRFTSARASPRLTRSM